MIKIAGKDLKTSRPSDLDAQLLASTGCAVSEIDTVLAAGAARAALALAPFLGKDAPPTGEIARAIIDDPEMIPAIRKLYADVPAAAEKPTA